MIVLKLELNSQNSILKSNFMEIIIHKSLTKNNYHNLTWHFFHFSWTIKWHLIIIGMRNLTQRSQTSEEKIGESEDRVIYCNLYRNSQGPNQIRRNSIIWYNEKSAIHSWFEYQCVIKRIVEKYIYEKQEIKIMQN